MNDVTIPHAFALCTTSSVSERGDMDSENQYGDPGSSDHTVWNHQ